MESPGEKLLLKLWETLVEKGIGNLLKPLQIRREGRALTDVKKADMLELAQAESDVLAIKTGQKKLLPTGELVDCPALPAPKKAAEPQTPSLAEPSKFIAIADQNAKAERIRQEVAVAKAVLHAEEELRNDTSEPTADKPDEDWLLRWRECAASVSSDKLQEIWGKVLAGEVKSPGQFSLRTLEFLRNLTQAEAKAIEKIMPFVIEDFVFCGDKAFLGAEGIDFGYLMMLQELGVLAGVDAFGLEVKKVSTEAKTFRNVFICNEVLLVVTAPEPKKTILLGAYPLTTIGKQGGLNLEAQHRHYLLNPT